ncbi:MAG: DUF3253 domain-containing protein [Bosea sp. (in: a-proteobacteria)]
MTDASQDDVGDIEVTILRLVAERGLDKTICPSEAARAIGGPHPDGWGPLMQPVRKAAVRLAHQGALVITRKGRVVDPDNFKGVYRLALPPVEG